MNSLGPFITPAEFQRLPLLLDYSQVLACGLSRHDLEGGIASGQITFVQLRPDGRRRYHKADIAKILKIDL